MFLMTPETCSAERDDWIPPKPTGNPTPQKSNRSLTEYAVKIIQKADALIKSGQFH
jgi:hypothetical protein